MRFSVCNVKSSLVWVRLCGPRWERSSGTLRLKGAIFSPRVLLRLALLSLVVGGCGGNRGPNPDATGPAATPKPIATELGIEMVPIPAGEFLMGDDRGEDEERPAHRVRISAFYMDTCEVTQESYQRLMGRAPSKFKGPARPVE